MRTPSLRFGFKTKFVLLALAWVMWFFGSQVSFIHAATCIDSQTTSERPCRPGELDINGIITPTAVAEAAAPSEDIEVTVVGESPAGTRPGTPAPVNAAAAPAAAASDPNQVTPARVTPRPADPNQVAPARVTPQVIPAAPGRSEPLRNPLSRISTIPDLLSAILTVVIVIAIPIIILFIMLAGFKYVTANGNAAQVKEASTALLYAVIGGVMIIGATAIAQIIKNLVNAFAS